MSAEEPWRRTPAWGCLFLRDSVPIDTKGGLAAAAASEEATNNVAEYVALINALIRAGVIITKKAGGEVNMEKAKHDLALFQDHFEVPLLVLGV